MIGQVVSITYYFVLCAGVCVCVCHRTGCVAYLFVLCTGVGTNCESQDRLCDLFVLCTGVGTNCVLQDRLYHDLPICSLYRCRADCVSHSLDMLYAVRLLFVYRCVSDCDSQDRLYDPHVCSLCTGIHSKLFESQDNLCDLNLSYRCDLQNYYVHECLHTGVTYRITIM